ncbi:MAG TPA: glycosyltransferase family 39 protein [Planctomycetota bacterium]|nr:glycosyltransferase family 39 protein [Planctomycetota bacterium]
MNGPTAPRPLPRWIADPSRRIGALALLAIFTRLLASLTDVVIHPDSPRYLKMATLIGQARFGEAFRIYPWSHPLYSILVAFGEVFVKNQLGVALAVASVLGGLGVVPFFHLARAGWGERVATLAALLYAFLPEMVELHGQALPEGPFYFFFLSGMALAWSAVERKSWERAVLGGLSASAAWMTRPEGMYVPLLLLFALAWHPRRFSLAAAGLFLASALVLSYPYLTFIRQETGKWGVSASPLSKGVLGLLTGETKATGYQVDPSRDDQPFGPYRYIVKFGKILGPVLYILKTCAQDLSYVLAPFLVLGFIFLRTPETRWGPASYLVGAGVGYAIPPCLAFVAATPFSYRYILPSMVFFLPVVAVGLERAARWSRWRPALATFLLVTCLAMSVRFMRPKMNGKIALKEAGTAILRAYGPGRHILGTRREVEFYARGEFSDIPYPPIPLSAVEAILEKDRIDTVAIFEDDLKNCPPGTKELVERNFVPMGLWPQTPRKDVSSVRVWVKPR